MFPHLPDGIFMAGFHVPTSGYFQAVGNRFVRRFCLWPGRSDFDSAEDYFSVIFRFGTEFCIPTVCGSCNNNPHVFLYPKEWKLLKVQEQGTRLCNRAVLFSGRIIQIFVCFLFAGFDCLANKRGVFLDFSVRNYFFFEKCGILLQQQYAPLAQLDRAFGYEPEGHGFESLRAYHF